MKGGGAIRGVCTRILISSVRSASSVRLLAKERQRSDVANTSFVWGRTSYYGVGRMSYGLFTRGIIHSYIWSFQCAGCPHDIRHITR